MFKLNYKILKEERERLSSVKSSFEIEHVYGQIEFKFNNSTEGIICEEIPDLEELLLVIFNLLNDVIINFSNSNYVAIELPDDNNVWFEFIIEDTKLKVSNVRGVENEVGKMRKCLKTKIPIEKEEVFWTEYINFDEFINEIFKKTDEFQKELLSINELFLDFVIYKNLNQRNVKAKNKFNL